MERSGKICKSAPLGLIVSMCRWSLPAGTLWKRGDWTRSLLRIWSRFWSAENLVMVLISWKLGSCLDQLKVFFLRIIANLSSGGCPSRQPSGARWGKEGASQGDQSLPGATSRGLKFSLIFQMEIKKWMAGFWSADLPAMVFHMLSIFFSMEQTGKSLLIQLRWEGESTDLKLVCGFRECLILGKN